MTASPIPAKIRKTVLDRADSRCEHCGRMAPLELHHRQYLSRGGKHAVSNLVALCGGSGGYPGGNHSGSHGWAHTTIEAEDKGFSIRSGFDPHEVKIELFGIGPAFLLDDGSVKPVEG